MSRACQRKNLVLGIAEGMEWEHLEMFVRSLRQTSFDGEVRIFVAGASKPTLRALRAYGVYVHSYHRGQLRIRGRVIHLHDPPLKRFGSGLLGDFYRGLIRAAPLVVRDPERGMALLAAPISPPAVARYFRYYRFLSKRADQYANVMLADTRDVFFQTNPFEFQLMDRLLCFLEHPAFTLGTQEYNRYHITRLFGEATMQDVEHLPICNSGVVIGSSRAVLVYLRAMVDCLFGMVGMGRSVRSDQAVHNVVVHTQLAPDIMMMPYGEGPVINLAITPEEEVAAALPDGYSAYNVIHQYDRHRQLRQLLTKRLDAPGSS